VDINEDTGFMKFDINNRVSVFTGLYMLRQVTNKFNKGQFLQTLSLVRLPNQKSYLNTNTDPATRSDEQREQQPQENPVENVDDISADPIVNEQDVDESGAAPETPEEATSPQVDPDQADLANVKNNADSETIGSGNEPQLVPPLTANDQQRAELLAKINASGEELRNTRDIGELIGIYDRQISTWNQLLGILTDPSEISQINDAIASNKATQSTLQTSLASGRTVL